MGIFLKGINKIKNSFVLQHDYNDCGVACLLNIIRYFEGDESLEVLRRESGTNISGTTILGLISAARKVGFISDGYEADISSLFEQTYPVILHVTIENNLKHYVVYYGVIEAKFDKNIVIGDPARGILFLSKSELESIWISKACITFEPNDKFRNAKIIKKQKRLWIKSLIQVDIHILLFAVCLGILISVLGLAMAFFTQRLIDHILPTKDYERFNLGFIFLILFLLIRELLIYLRQYVLMKQSKDFNVRIIDYFYSHLLQLPKTFFDSRKIGDLTARLADTSRIQRTISQIVGSVIVDFLVAIVTLSYLFSLNLTVGLICLFALPLYFIVIYSQTKRISKNQLNVMIGHATNEANYISTLQGIEPIKNYRKIKFFSNSNKRLYENYQIALFKLGKVQISLSLIANVFGAIFLTIIMFYISNKILLNQAKIGQLMAIMGLTSTLLLCMANLALITIPLKEAKIAFDRMFEFTAIDTEQIQHNNYGNEIINFQALEIKNVSFRFVGRSSLLKNISFSIEKGKIVALLGENGSGKTSISQILLKNLSYESGTIEINKITELKTIDINSWRKIIGLVPQNIHIFNASVLENIAFDDAITDPNKVISFLEKFGFDKQLISLPQSYFTLVGEEGINLSGGQKQMIAIARALFHNPQFLVLDEATASMDRDNEQFVLNLLQILKHDIAILFITHRLHILKSFSDSIYILENGTITTNGSHNELIKYPNLYSAYWSDLKAES